MISINQGYFKNIKEYNELTSTNEFALKECRNGHLIEGDIIVAKHQTAGKGRYGNKWVSKSNKDLLVSFIIKPTCLKEEIYKIPIQFSLSVFDALRLYIPNQLRLFIKWPNDFLIEKKKCAGVLASYENKSQLLVIGLGVNINSSWNNDEIESLSNIMKNHIPVHEVLYDIINKLNQNIESILSGKIQNDRYNANAAFINQYIEVTENNRVIRGIFNGIEASGKARINTNNTIKLVHNGLNFRSIT